MIRVENLCAGYKELHILFDINAVIEKGKITTVAGPNGSGKSTFLKSIFGLATIHSGKVIFKNRDITKIPPHEKTKIGMAYVPQVDNIFTNLTVEENLKIAGYTLEKKEYKERLDLAMEVFPEIKKKLKQNGGTLSGGERQFLAIASALIKKAELLVLDEPTAMLSPKLAAETLRKITELNEELGLTVLIVEQNVKKALEISDNAYMLMNGRIVFGGKSEELLGHEKFENFCIGI
ncbi:ABC transporter ATP-binding protein [Methanosarcina hadiensis]|uniref:branched-chain amino acid ABC transporter ATP-binding protein n=1 Tax=Methanosarcina hadiensis TaxID=3078083 RepID=UPI003977CC0A